MTNPMVTQAIVECIDRIETCNAMQKDIDDVYTHFCDIYYGEMDRLL